MVKCSVELRAPVELLIKLHSFKFLLAYMNHYW